MCRSCRYARTFDLRCSTTLICSEARSEAALTDAAVSPLESASSSNREGVSRLSMSECAMSSVRTNRMDLLTVLLTLLNVHRIVHDKEGF